MVPPSSNGRTVTSGRRTRQLRKLHGRGCADRLRATARQRAGERRTRQALESIRGTRCGRTTRRSRTGRWLLGDTETQCRSTRWLKVMSSRPHRTANRAGSAIQAVGTAPHPTPNRDARRRGTGFSQVGYPVHSPCMAIEMGRGCPAHHRTRRATVCGPARPSARLLQRYGRGRQRGLPR